MIAKGLSVIFFICAVLAQDPSKNDDSNLDVSTDLKNHNQDWRALDYFSPASDASGWVPHQSSEDGQIPKRRRIRKRKRRPPMISLTEEQETRPLIREPWEEIGEEAIEKPRRKSSPVYLPEKIRESWEESKLEKHPENWNNPRPVYRESENIREIWEEKQKVVEPEKRKLTPVYQEPEKIRDPFTALQEAEEKQKTKPEATQDLKTLLKQSGGLSLSEILQQKNLTLAELLMGNRQAISALTEKNDVIAISALTEKNDVIAISALTEKNDVPTTELAPLETTKYKRLPPSIGLRKNINRNYEQSGESVEGLTSEEVLEAQRKRLSLLHHKDSKIFQDVTKFDVVTEATTEKRIFVPSNPPVFESYEDKEISTTIPTTQATTTTTLEKKLEFNKLKPKLKGILPLTSAKLKLTSKMPLSEVATLPPQAVKIDINEIFGFGAIDKPDDEPFRMTIDLDSIATTPQAEKLSSPNQLGSRTTTITPLVEKIKHVTAKEEIMEILKDPIDRANLSKILQVRNMTVEELVEQRERGSSQLHLADIFHNSTKEPEPKEEAFLGEITPEYFNNFPVFSRKQKSRPIPTIVKKELSSGYSPGLQPEIVSSRPKELYSITSFPTYKIESKKNLNSPPPFLPIWKKTYPTMFTDIYQDNNQEANVEIVQITSTTEKFTYDDLQRLEEIENTLAEAASSRFNVNLLHNYNEDLIMLPSGVKSAIIASMAIIGLSLLVFLTILVIFKWNQRQKRRLGYSSSFSGSKIKSPILEPDQKRSLKALMSETLGRKKINYYQTHLQSMSDSIWDTEKKPYI